MGSSLDSGSDLELHSGSDVGLDVESPPTKDPGTGEEEEANFSTANLVRGEITELCVFVYVCVCMCSLCM